MDELTDVDLVAALAAFQGLDVSEEDVRALVPWFRDIRRGLADLRSVDVGDVLQLDPLLVQPPWSDGEP